MYAMLWFLLWTTVLLGLLFVVLPWIAAQATVANKPRRRRLIDIGARVASAACAVLISGFLLTGCTVPDAAWPPIWHGAEMLLGFLASTALAWLFKKLNDLITARTHTTWVASLLHRLDDAVETVVMEITQTAAAQLKNDDASGKLTADEGARLKQRAIDDIKSYIGPKGLALLMHVLGLDDGTLTKLIASKVEAKVASQPKMLAVAALKEAK